jgi:hypothetical protein
MIDPVHADFVEAFLPFARRSRDTLAIWTRALLGVKPGAPIEILGEKTNPDDELERERCERAAQAIERQDGVDLILARPFDLLPSPKGFTREHGLRVFNRYFEGTTAKPAKVMIDCRKGWARKACNVSMLTIKPVSPHPNTSMLRALYDFDSDIRHDVPMAELLAVWRRP